MLLLADGWLVARGWGEGRRCHVVLHCVCVQVGSAVYASCPALLGSAVLSLI